MVSQAAGVGRIRPGTLGADGIVRVAGGAGRGPGKRRGCGVGLYQRGVPAAIGRSGDGVHQFPWGCPLQWRKGTAGHVECRGGTVGEMVGVVPLGDGTTQTWACRLALLIPKRDGVTGGVEKDRWRDGFRRVQVACPAKMWCGRLLFLGRPYPADHARRRVGHPQC